MLLHRLALLFNKANKNPDVIRLFVYTGTLKDFIRSGIEVTDIPEECVSTFDKWCMDSYRRYISNRLPRLAKGGIDFDAIRQGVYEAVRNGKIVTPIFDYVLVDETQDLDVEALEVLSRIARHVTVCMDGKQQIYGGRASESEILESLGLARQNSALLAAYRCNPMVTQLAARLIDDEARRREFMNQAANAAMDRSKPLFFLAQDFNEEKERLIQSLKVRLGYGDSIAVLFPQQRQVHGFAQGIKQAGIEVEIHQRDAAMDFRNGLPKLMTYHQAKGLTFDSVFLPRLVKASFAGALENQLEHLLFVGISRAVKWVYLSGTNGSLARSAMSLWREDTGSFLEKQMSSGSQGLFTDEETAQTAMAEADDFGLD